MDVVPLLRGRFGRPYSFVARCKSTQRMLDGAPEGAVAAADEQTEGRGRLGRSWHAPPGSSLLFSIVLTPGVPAERLPELSVVAGEAVAEAIATEADLPATVKHPNDVLIRGRKVAGVLAEAGEGRVVLGIGINLSQRADELPADATHPATSLALEGAVVDRAALFATVLERLERRYDAWVTAAGI
jgi:BirA family transcriptional regulator, biotin operon repressor / biotin---[acetyl-CoA-carboxylase] ligase